MLKLIPLLIASLALTASSVGAQPSRASVRGLVRDQSGLPVARANVRAARGDTGESRLVITDEGGRFALAQLEVGEYRFDVTLAGFAAYTRQAQLAVGQDVWLEVSLSVAVRQDVDVSEIAGRYRHRALGTSVTLRAEGARLTSGRVVEAPLGRFSRRESPWIPEPPHEDRRESPPRARPPRP